MEISRNSVLSGLAATAVIGGAGAAVVKTTGIPINASVLTTVGKVGVPIAGVVAPMVALGLVRPNDAGTGSLVGAAAGALGGAAALGVWGGSGRAVAAAAAFGALAFGSIGALVGLAN